MTVDGLIAEASRADRAQGKPGHQRRAPTGEDRQRFPDPFRIGASGNSMLFPDDGLKVAERLVVHIDHVVLRG